MQSFRMRQLENKKYTYETKCCRFPQVLSERDRKQRQAYAQAKAIAQANQEEAERSDEMKEEGEGNAAADDALASPLPGLPPLPPLPRVVVPRKSPCFDGSQSMLTLSGILGVPISCERNEVMLGWEMSSEGCEDPNEVRVLLECG